MAKAVKDNPTTAAAPKRKAPAAPAGRGKNLVVVESPAKAKTINRYLGDDYVVRASMGHVRDLPKKSLGVDVDNGFQPTYEPLATRKNVLTELKKYAKSASQVFLATDLDREGEAIAWHLAESLNVPMERVRRVVFNEITAGAIREAFSQPRMLDMNKVNAQQARRILDRIVGYEISPLLWRKVATGLSAGRVQSVAVRLIVERERQIDAFVPEEYWKLQAIFTPKLSAAGELARQWAALLARRDEKGNGPPQAEQQQFLAEKGAFQAELAQWRGQRFDSLTAETAIEAAKALGLDVSEIRRTEDPKGKGPAKNLVKVVGTVGAQAAKFTVSALRTRERRSRPMPPFTTSTMQQAASVQLRFSASRTMRTAQQLYEGVEIPGEGSVGLITYMRTDSTHLSQDALNSVRQLIGKDYGQAYVPEKPNFYASSERAQEAHEAVRPTDAGRRPEDLRSALSDEQFKLYQLIWRRFVSCQMTPAVWEITEVDVTARTPLGEALFKAAGRTLKFDGHLRVAGVPRAGEQLMPELKETQPLAPVQLTPTQHFTQPPPRFTEASLVKALEADGIGRPSTYASIIQTIQDRGYVRQENRAFMPTDLGIVVTDKLVKHFPQVFDVRFTAHMEDELDKVEDAHADWVAVLREFYGPFHQKLEVAREEMVHAKAETEPSPYACVNCGKPMIYRFSKTGRYLACTGYPECKTTHPVDREGKKIENPPMDVACPKCGKPMLLRRGRFGPFLSCPEYPNCGGVVNLDRKGFVKHPSAPALKVDLACPKCKAQLALRRGKRGPWLACSKYPKCRARLAWTTLAEDQQKALELALMNHEKANPVAKLLKVDGTPIGENYKPQRLDGSGNQGEQEIPAASDEISE